MSKTPKWLTKSKVKNNLYGGWATVTRVISAADARDAAEIARKRIMAVHKPLAVPEITVRRA